ncbi:MAG: SDR family NAD(P)-dependent oxidoreductase [Anaerolineales bacterium]|nr:SDR family NAD(P)-dependent oxidoreductase [Anaerolineales bacterium]
MSNAIIWGANGGIGTALLELLSAQGWYSVAVLRDRSRLQVPAGEVIEARFEQPESVAQAVALASQAVEQVDLWVYAAGDILSAKVAELRPADWQRILSANLTGAYLAYYHSLPLLAPEAHVFFLGAVSERLRLPGLSAYAAAKAGLEAFVTALSKEERHRRFTIVRPGAVDTPLWDKVPLRLPKDAASPQKVAEKILAAYQDRHTGQLDLV